MTTSNRRPMTIRGLTAGTAEIDQARVAYQLGGASDGPPVLLWHGRAGRPLTLVAHDMGAPPALLWAAQHPEEVGGLAYLEEPVLLPSLLEQLIAYTPDATRLGGLWWWMTALAPGLAEQLIGGGHERGFLEWNYQHYAAHPDAIEPDAIEEYLRSFGAPGGVTGAFGVYRGVPRTVEQTAPLTGTKVQVPILGLGGEHSLSGRVADMLTLVADHVEGATVAGCEHFIPEEAPDDLVDRLAAVLPRVGS